MLSGPPSSVPSHLLTNGLTVTPLPLFCNKEGSLKEHQVKWSFKVHDLIILRIVIPFYQTRGLSGIWISVIGLFLTFIFSGYTWKNN